MRFLRDSEAELVCGGIDAKNVAGAVGGFVGGALTAAATKSPNAARAGAAAGALIGMSLAEHQTLPGGGPAKGGFVNTHRGNSSSRVICTHFYRKGMLDQAIWRADMAFTFKNLSPATVRGYQFWAIPYVRLMRKSTVAEKFMFPLAKWRAQELAYQMGVVSKGSWRGKLVRLTCEPICWALGVCVGEQNWQSLYEPAK